MLGLRRRNGARRHSEHYDTKDAYEKAHHQLHPTLRELRKTLHAALHDALLPLPLVKTIDYSSYLTQQVASLTIGCQSFRVVVESSYVLSHGFRCETVVVQVFMACSAASVALNLLRKSLWLRRREEICIAMNCIYAIYTFIKVFNLVPRLPNEDHYLFKHCLLTMMDAYFCQVPVHKTYMLQFIDAVARCVVWRRYNVLPNAPTIVVIIVSLAWQCWIIVFSAMLQARHVTSYMRRLPPQVAAAAAGHSLVAPVSMATSSLSASSSTAGSMPVTCLTGASAGTGTTFGGTGRVGARTALAAGVAQGFDAGSGVPALAQVGLGPINTGRSGGAAGGGGIVGAYGSLQRLLLSRISAVSDANNSSPGYSDRDREQQGFLAALGAANASASNSNSSAALAVDFGYFILERPAPSVPLPPHDNLATLSGNTLGNPTCSGLSASARLVRRSVAAQSPVSHEQALGLREGVELGALLTTAEGGVSSRESQQEQQQHGEQELSVMPVLVPLALRAGGGAECSNKGSDGVEELEAIGVDIPEKLVAHHGGPGSQLPMPSTNSDSFASSAASMAAAVLASAASPRALRRVSSTSHTSLAAHTSSLLGVSPVTTTTPGPATAARGGPPSVAALSGAASGAHASGMLPQFPLVSGTPLYTGRRSRQAEQALRCLVRGPSSYVLLAQQRQQNKTNAAAASIASVQLCVASAQPEQLVAHWRDRLTVAVAQGAPGWTVASTSARHGSLIVHLDLVYHPAAATAWPHCAAAAPQASATATPPLQTFPRAVPQPEAEASHAEGMPATFEPACRITANGGKAAAPVLISADTPTEVLERFFRDLGPSGMLDALELPDLQPGGPEDFISVQQGNRLLRFCAEPSAQRVGGRRRPAAQRANEALGSGSRKGSGSGLGSVGGDVSDRGRASRRTAAADAGASADAAPAEMAAAGRAAAGSLVSAEIEEAASGTESEAAPSQVGLRQRRRRAPLPSLASPRIAGAARRDDGPLQNAPRVHTTTLRPRPAGPPQHRLAGLLASAWASGAALRDAIGLALWPPALISSREYRSFLHARAAPLHLTYAYLMSGTALGYVAFRPGCGLKLTNVVGFMAPELLTLAGRAATCGHEVAWAAVRVPLVHLGLGLRGALLLATYVDLLPGVLTQAGTYACMRWIMKMLLLTGLQALCMQVPVRGAFAVRLLVLAGGILTHTEVCHPDSHPLPAVMLHVGWEVALFLLAAFIQARHIAAFRLLQLSVAGSGASISLSNSSSTSCLWSLASNASSESPKVAAAGPRKPTASLEPTALASTAASDTNALPAYDNSVHAVSTGPSAEGALPSHAFSAGGGDGGGGGGGGGVVGGSGEAAEAGAGPLSASLEDLVLEWAQDGDWEALSSAADGLASAAGGDGSSSGGADPYDVALDCCVMALAPQKSQALRLGFTCEAAVVDELKVILRHVSPASMASGVHTAGPAHVIVRGLAAPAGALLTQPPGAALRFEAEVMVAAAPQDMPGVGYVELWRGRRRLAGSPVLMAATAVQASAGGPAGQEVPRAEMEARLGPEVQELPRWLADVQEYADVIVAEGHAFAAEQFVEELGGWLAHAAAMQRGLVGPALSGWRPAGGRDAVPVITRVLRVHHHSEPHDLGTEWGGAVGAQSGERQKDGDRSAALDERERDRGAPGEPGPVPYVLRGDHAGATCLDLLRHRQRQQLQDGARVGDAAAATDGDGAGQAASLAAAVPASWAHPAVAAARQVLLCQGQGLLAVAVEAGCLALVEQLMGVLESALGATVRDVLEGAVTPVTALPLLHAAVKSGRPQMVDKVAKWHMLAGDAEIWSREAVIRACTLEAPSAPQPQPQAQPAEHSARPDCTAQHAACRFACAQGTAGAECTGADEAAAESDGLCAALGAGCGVGDTGSEPYYFRYSFAPQASASALAARDGSADPRDIISRADDQARFTARASEGGSCGGVAGDAHNQQRGKQEQLAVSFQHSTIHGPQGSGPAYQPAQPYQCFQARTWAYMQREVLHEYDCDYQPLSGPLIFLGPMGSSSQADAEGEGDDGSGRAGIGGTARGLSLTDLRACFTGVPARPASAAMQAATADAGGADNIGDADGGCNGCQEPPTAERLLRLTESVTLAASIRALQADFDGDGDGEDAHGAALRAERTEEEPEEQDPSGADPTQSLTGSFLLATLRSSPRGRALMSTSIICTSPSAAQWGPPGAGAEVRPVDPEGPIDDPPEQQADRGPEPQLQHSPAWPGGGDRGGPALSTTAAAAAALAASYTSTGVSVAAATAAASLAQAVTAAVGPDLLSGLSVPFRVVSLRPPPGANNAPSVSGVHELPRDAQDDRAQGDTAAPPPLLICDPRFYSSLHAGGGGAGATPTADDDTANGNAAGSVAGTPGNMLTGSLTSAAAVAPGTAPSAGLGAVHACGGFPPAMIAASTPSLVAEVQSKGGEGAAAYAFGRRSRVSFDAAMSYGAACVSASMAGGAGGVAGGGSVAAGPCGGWNLLEGDLLLLTPLHVALALGDEGRIANHIFATYPEAYEVWLASQAYWLAAGAPGGYPSVTASAALDSNNTLPSPFVTPVYHPTASHATPGPSSASPLWGAAFANTVSASANANANANTSPGQTIISAHVLQPSAIALRRASNTVLVSSASHCHHTAPAAPSGPNTAGGAAGTTGRSDQGLLSWVGSSACGSAATCAVGYGGAGGGAGGRMSFDNGPAIRVSSGGERPGFPLWLPPRASSQRVLGAGAGGGCGVVGSAALPRWLSQTTCQPASSAPALGCIRDEEQEGAEEGQEHRVLGTAGGASDCRHLGAASPAATAVGVQAARPCGDGGCDGSRWGVGQGSPHAGLGHPQESLVRADEDMEEVLALSLSGVAICEGLRWMPPSGGGGGGEPAAPSGPFFLHQMGHQKSQHRRK